MPVAHAGLGVDRITCCSLDSSAARAPECNGVVKVLHAPRTPDALGAFGMTLLGSHLDLTMVIKLKVQPI